MNDTKDMITEENQYGSMDLLKVPLIINLTFWVAKIITTALGETFSDFIFFNDAIGQHAAILIGLLSFAIILMIQFRTRKYTPWVYWLCVTSVSVFGTMLADFMNKDLGIPLYASTLIFALTQTAVFIAWYKTEHTLSIHSINTGRKEIFYWLTVLCTFGLGTAAGDFTADTLGLGTLLSTGIFLVLIAVPLVGYKFFGMNSIFAFWFAYTMTRPLGASFGDWLAVPAPYGDGLQLGTGIVSLGFGILMVIAVAYIDRQHRKENRLPEKAAA
jgi:Uncharacterized membrane-anchored protein conserved in bacteria